MKSSYLLSLVFLAIGIAFVVWGISANNSLASEMSEAVHGAPSNKSMALLALGALASVVGVVGLIRRR
ncbi:MAG: DUF3185 family protein [Planctomycetes bacterium]|nr:DUF3185 family protein [Planctomycetota bacterium]